MVAIVTTIPNEPEFTDGTRGDKGSDQKALLENAPYFRLGLITAHGEERVELMQ